MDKLIPEGLHILAGTCAAQREMASIRKRGGSYLLVVSMGCTPDGRRSNPQQKTVKPSTTLDIYTHAFDKNKKAASQIMQSSLEI